MNYYEILGVEITASQEDIKRAYRKLANIYHPDKSSGDAAQFLKIKEAYSVLSDTDSREEYDHSFGEDKELVDAAYDQIVEILLQLTSKAIVEDPTKTVLDLVSQNRKASRNEIKKILKTLKILKRQIKSLKPGVSARVLSRKLKEKQLAFVMKLLELRRQLRFVTMVEKIINSLEFDIPKQTVSSTKEEQWHHLNEIDKSLESFFRGFSR